MKRIKFNKQNMEAYKAGNKTQTRRPIKPQPMDEDSGYFTWVSEYGLLIHYSYDELFKLIVEDGYSPYVIGEEVSITDEDGNEFARDRIKSIRAERLQDISEEDAIAEGAKCTAVLNTAKDDYTGLFAMDDFLLNVWDEIYAGTEFGWIKNPLVWVIELEGIGEIISRENA